MKNTFKKHNDLIQSIKLCNQSIKDEPNNPEAYYGKINALIELKKYKLAQYAYKLAMKRMDKNYSGQQKFLDLHFIIQSALDAKKDLYALAAQKVLKQNKAKNSK